MARDRGRGCPNRWRINHASQFSKPQRPVSCPCLWSRGLTENHFYRIVLSDPPLYLTFKRLLRLFPN